VHDSRDNTFLHHNVITDNGCLFHLLFLYIVFDVVHGISDFVFIFW